MAHLFDPSPSHFSDQPEKKTNKIAPGVAITCRTRVGQRALNMAVHRFAEVVQTLRRTTIPDESRVSDAQLLALFIERQDEFAFAALVKRHSPMVWGVCRRIVTHHQDAEDAFQATVLVLARKATSVRPRHLVANWLFGVAQRTALKAKTMAAKRHQRERQISDMSDVEATKPGNWENLEALIDQELANLPDKYRSAIVLCDLEGKKGKDVAQQLKIPEGTLASRLRTGRVLLAKRLTRRGVAFFRRSAATALSQNAPQLQHRDSSLQRSRPRFSAAGKQAAAGIVSANAATLTEGVMKMLLTKLNTVLAVLLVVGPVALGGGMLSRHVAAGQKQPPPTKKSRKCPPEIIADASVPNARNDKPKNADSTWNPASPTRDLKVSYPVLDLVTPFPAWTEPRIGIEKQDSAHRLP